MKRCLVALLSLLCLVVLPAAGQQTATVKVNANSVNLRRGASVDSGVVQALAKGTLLTVLARDGNWIKVQVQGQAASGWVRSDLVDAVPASPAAAQTPPAASPTRSNSVAPPPPPAAKAVAAPKPVSSAKDDGYRGGLTLFGGLTSFSISDTPPPTGVTLGNASGVAAGIGFIAHLGGPIGLELDGDYVQGGYAATVTSGGTTLAGTTHDNNVGGALLLRPAFGSGPVRGFLLGGVSVAYTINCSESVTTGAATTCTIDSTQNRTDEALVIGAGASYSMLALQVRYHIGLNNLTSLSGYTVKSKGLLVLLSVIL
jgi:uncharacterized protein YgiM (DUF1202 family)